MALFGLRERRGSEAASPEGKFKETWFCPELLPSDKSAKRGGQETQEASSNSAVGRKIPPPSMTFSHKRGHRKKSGAKEGKKGSTPSPQTRRGTHGGVLLKDR